jgi:hypothetical protein
VTANSLGQSEPDGFGTPRGEPRNSPAPGYDARIKHFVENLLIPEREAFLARLRDSHSTIAERLAQFEDQGAHRPGEVAKADLIIAFAMWHERIDVLVREAASHPPEAAASPEFVEMLEQSAADQSRIFREKGLTAVREAAAKFSTGRG